MQPGNDGRIGRYLRRNEKVWTPPCVITFDSEANRSADANGENQTLRLWCARLDDRRTPEKKQAQHLVRHGYTGASLASAIDEWCRGRETVWAYAHNLGYDLTLTSLISRLAETGWTVDRCSSVPDYLFLFLSKGRKRLTITDSHHLLPMSLDDIGSLTGHGKTRKPSARAQDSDWLNYCANDVNILADAVLQLMSHWDDYGLGNWAVSGAACGTRALRHMMPKGSVVLFNDPGSSALQRAAIYGGRRYCWRHGEQPPGRYGELDFTQAHATTAANYPMPVKAGSKFTSLPIGHKAIDSDLAVVIAECEIETSVPRFPVRCGDRVWYPTGRFTTTLASPEIRWARDLGCLKSVGRGQFHYTSAALQPFFQRVLSTSDDRNDAYPPVVRAMWKQWGRSVIGKFAQRGYSVTPTRMLTDRPWYYERAFDNRTGEEYWLIHYAGIVHEARESGDGSGAYPAILATVESYERVAIGKTADMLGTDVMIQCDTDGAWVDLGALENGAETGLGFALGDNPRQARIQLAIDVVNRQLGALQLREKHSVQRIAVWGPQNYDAGPHTRQSGRPKGLKEVSPGIWYGEQFPSVSYQMARAPEGTYRVERVSWTTPASVIPGWVTASGRVRPVQAGHVVDGRLTLSPWSAGIWQAAGDVLASVQHDALAGLWDPSTDCGEAVNGKPSIWERTPQEARALRASRRRTIGSPYTPPELLAVHPSR
jgi:hypothetical protein